MTDDEKVVTDIEIQIAREEGIRKEYVRSLPMLHAFLASAFAETARLHEKILDERRKKNEWKNRALAAEKALKS